MAKNYVRSRHNDVQFEKYIKIMIFHTQQMLKRGILLDVNVGRV